MKFEYSLSKNYFWFRINGYGFNIRRNSKPLFSERNGLRKVYRYKDIAFEFLTTKGY